MAEGGWVLNDIEKEELYIVHMNGYRYQFS